MAALKEWRTRGKVPDISFVQNRPCAVDVIRPRSILRKNKFAEFRWDSGKQLEESIDKNGVPTVSIAVNRRVLIDRGLELAPSSI
jgi:hypothetical protein